LVILLIAGEWSETLLVQKKKLPFIFWSYMIGLDTLFVRFNDYFD
jgi:hypothetical protein